MAFSLFHWLIMLCVLGLFGGAIFVAIRLFGGRR